LPLTGTRYDIDLYILVNTQREKFLTDLWPDRQADSLIGKSAPVGRVPAWKLNAIHAV